ncbi:MAG TPA: Gfo/Idh/MocA family oxidoreductase [Phycisphaerae bacterium]|jgi:predicted dehydrogenase|nr:Gfo/Idh/MocA family oxidoreductase [Phycisphaerae bacterium]HOB74504.1 Gfo/Idh/MocA family oxidoreductase [Phycisphaerae bacterium]HOJ54226.1 Gfo/Idh/MocA family oxidoreductase [Phycisphaerae bacterium]HOL26583.1 Gfo/Idh/MocA family oxidoreductase [Phycisphaerae bacterium]HPP20317.1 Gfo/Idh/MocA family oxidoreductase [Phycisphaerae bacterium]
MEKRITRRRFGAGIAAVGAAVAARPALGTLGANERIRLGIIGVGNRGDQMIDAFIKHADCEFTAICDVYEPYIEFAKQKVGGNPFTTGDYRKVLDRKDVDAVVIATPDHWHALQFIDACKAGKDIYVEKPLSLVVAEGRKMVEAAKKYDRITQMGTQRRSAPVCRRIAELVQSGALGKVMAARCVHISNEYPMGMGRVPDSDPPPGLDWDMWLGPAPKVPYNENRCFYKFRWFRSYSGGQVTNMATHYIDMLHMALGEPSPLGVFAGGGRYVLDDGREIPDTMEVVWEYPGLMINYTQYNANRAPVSSVKGRNAEVEIRGTEGTLYYAGGRIEIVPEDVRLEPLPALDPRKRQENARQARAIRPAREPLVETGRLDPADHARNFLDCVKTRKPCHCPVELGHRSTAATLLANLAYDRKRYLAWDAEKEQITNDPEANKLLSYEYRAPWKLEL